MQLPPVETLSTRNHRIAYRRREGKGPTVIFCGGFKSDMEGTKAAALDAFCAEQGRSYVRFDYTGHGQSSGDFKGGTIGQWVQDALDVIDQCTEGKLVVVGSSMGGWVMLHAALKRPERVQALVGLASAPDFTEKLMWQQFSDTQKAEMEQNGVVYLPSCYGEEPYPITRQLIEDGRTQQLLDAPIGITCPVRLIHGTEDEDVPYQVSLQLMDVLESTDVRVQLLKNSGHRLSEPHELAVVRYALESVL